MDKQTICFLLHGFNVKDGGYATVDQIKPLARELYDMIPYDHDYGWVGLIRLRRLNTRVAKQIAKHITLLRSDGHKVIIVAHSNGCAITYEAMRDYRLIVDGAIFINPALNKEVLFADSYAKKFVCLHNSGDFVTEHLAGWWRGFVNFLPYSRMKYGKHMWGSAGQEGFDGPYALQDDSLRVMQQDTKDVLNAHPGMSVHGHSGIFKNQLSLDYWLTLSFNHIGVK